MSRKEFFAIALQLCLLCIDATSSHAFDGKRHGFVLGVGAGPGYVSANGSHPNDSWGSISTSIKMGHGYNDRFQLYFLAATSFNRDFIPFLEATPSLGVSYYLDDGPTAVYLLGGAGIELLASVSATGPFVGPAIRAGLGFELRRKWSLELNLNWSRVMDIYSQVADLNVWDVSFLFGIAFY